MMLNNDIELWIKKQPDLLKEARCCGGTSYFVRVNGMKYYFMWKNDKGEFHLEFYLKPYVWGDTVSVALGVGLIIFTFVFGIVEVAKPDLEEPLVPYANKANVVLTKYLPTLEVPYLKWNDEWSKGKFPRKLIGE